MQFFRNWFRVSTRLLRFRTNCLGCLKAELARTRRTSGQLRTQRSSLFELDDFVTPCKSWTLISSSKSDVALFPFPPPLPYLDRSLSLREEYLRGRRKANCLGRRFTRDDNCCFIRAGLNSYLLVVQVLRGTNTFFWVLHTSNGNAQCRVCCSSLQTFNSYFYRKGTKFISFLYNKRVNGLFICC